MKKVMMSFATGYFLSSLLLIINTITIIANLIFKRYCFCNSQKNFHIDTINCVIAL